MQEWTKDLTKDGLPNEDLKLVADYYGVDLAVKFMEDLPGTLINVPKTGLNKCRNQYICQVYDGSKKSRVKLSNEFGVTEGYIKQLASRYRKNMNLN